MATDRIRDAIGIARKRQAVAKKPGGQNVIGIGRSLKCLEKKTGPIAVERTTADASSPTIEECKVLLRIIETAPRIGSHYELFLWFQGEIQRFIPNQILISAWGDFRASDLGFDVVSALPGVRTGQLDGSCIERLLKNCFARWAANGWRPLLLDEAAYGHAAHSDGSSCALHAATRSMHSALLHGIHNERDGINVLYLAFDPQAITKGQGFERLAFLADLLIPAMDVAFRKVPVLRTSGQNALRDSRSLSARKQEIMKWIGEGKTNPEIGEILDISPLTVKNHVQQILRKLGVTNRIEALMKCRPGSLAL